MSIVWASALLDYGKRQLNPIFNLSFSYVMMHFQYDLSYNAMTYWTGKERSAPKAKMTLIPVLLKSDTMQFSSRTELVALRLNLC